LSKLRVAKLGLITALGGILSLTTQVVLASPKVFTESIVPVPDDIRVVGTPSSDAPVEFQVALKMRNFANLEKRIAAGETISSTQLVANYYPLESDYQSLLQWLTAKGLTIEQTFPNHLSVVVSGTVATVQQAMGVEFATVNVNSKAYVAASTAPKLPDDIAQFVLGINGLQPYLQAYPHHIVRESYLPGFRPQTSQPPYLVDEIKSAYNATGLNVDGTGEKIAILIDRFPNDRDLTQFWSDNSVSQSLSNIEKVAVVNNIPTTPDVEESLDVEWSSSIAPGSKVRIYATGNLTFVNIDKGFQKLIADLSNQPTLHQLSISLGACEAQISSSQKQTDSQFLATIASKKVTIFVSSGDSGSKGNCSSGKGVEYLASDPNVTAVGGTSLDAPLPGVIDSETAWSGSGGGISSFFNRPSFQVGPGVPSGKLRLVPDVALEADPNTGVYLVVNGVIDIVGGTSFSAPAWAGFNALINQGRVDRQKPPLGLLGPRIYRLLKTSSFRDITSGNNGDFSAQPGYDQVTGIGVPRVNTLLRTLVKQP